MSVTHKKTRTEFNQDIINDYIGEHGDAPVRMSEIASWAVRTRRWRRPLADDVKICARELAQAARAEYYEDPQGRKVRTKHVVRRVVIDDKGEKQAMFEWADIRTAQPDHMQIALQQRRQAILWDCKQHQTDTESYNDNNIHGAQLFFDYSFNEDLDELKHDETYPDSPPSEDDDDSDA